jgi:hypothetical protein
MSGELPTCESGDPARTIERMDDMRWRNLFFWADQLLIDERVLFPQACCSICDFMQWAGESHHPACPRGRLAAVLDELRPEWDREPG